MHEIMFFMAHISLIMLGPMLFLVVKFRTKTKQSRFFIMLIIGLIVWTLSVLLEEYSSVNKQEHLIIYFENLTYFGVVCTAVGIAMIGVSFYPVKNRRLIWILLCIVPLITQIVVWTNPLHNAFYVNYSLVKSEIVVGWYFYIHTVYSYACLLFGMGLIIRFAMGSRGNSRWQAIIICVGSFTPLFMNICYTFNLPGFTIFSTPVAFMLMTITYIIGIFRFNLLRVTPLALRTVIDKTSDLYLVIDDKMRILDYNEPFFSVFSQFGDLKKNMELSKVLGNNKVGISSDNFFRIIDDCREVGIAINKEFKLLSNGKIKYYSVEFAPLLIEGVYCGCILLLRDITQAKNDMDEIKRNQTMLIERERLASLGNLMGGIAHNLKTPIMAVSSRVESLYVLISEYEASLSDAGVTKDDHLDIASDMHKQVSRIKDHISYVSDIISTVKDQTIKFNAGARGFFSVEELIKRVEILLQHELMSRGCQLNVELLVPEELRLNGDIIALVQILDNIVINAIQAYNGIRGEIRLKISQAEGELIISIADKAGGIKKEIQQKLFRQMITTKGTDGTGLGLYISFSTVVGMFGGRLEFNSVENEGTEFIITLPLPEKTTAKEEQADLRIRTNFSAGAKDKQL